MTPSSLTPIAVLIAALWIGPARAQVANLPANVQQALAEMGPSLRLQNLILRDKMTELFAPLLSQSPKEGVQVTRDLSYGSDGLQKFDLYQPEGKRGVPIVVVVHGGAFVMGKREGYWNVAMYFARHGMLGVTTDYRLAPAAPWPAGAEDVGTLVKWLKANASKYGGDPDRIFLIGHSAGANHVASYAYIPSLHPPEGPGVAGVVLVGPPALLVDPKEDLFNFKNIQAYFGTDSSLYPVRSAINYVNTTVIPTFIVIAEYEVDRVDIQGANFFAALCARDGVCPRFTRLALHNHFSICRSFNTADEALGREILDFIKRGR